MKKSPDTITLTQDNVDAYLMLKELTRDGVIGEHKRSVLAVAKELNKKTPFVYYSIKKVNEVLFNGIRR
jgi:hypothetical protein